ncbi:hypothetical protein FV222_05275 [Methylobacterium sp. WL103]|uniref:hypothetical protein n=1 Tax=unclassified Methylobacterium TaxID=2615210 RepID=UPI0011CC39D2|nr:MULTISPECIES: hypothetical protein [unclassified Methylobacterium]TXM70622.1 hypothetical protein FV226_16740 [Methylobacterium sp. WL12]TXN06582.1 hypothetical protein FV222_05275 [Methylobacterium sp. WL103]
MISHSARAFLAALTLTVGLAPVTAFAGPAQSYQYERRTTGRMCRPPLKFAAGACVRRCPAGFRDNGGYCRQLSQRF